MTREDYLDAVNWLFIQAPNYQVDGIKAYKPGLDNIKNLCAFFGNPHNDLKCIHIGGTNGKGSTSNMLASILQEQGYKVGLYNSPHLVDFTERIKINGTLCDKEFVYNFIQKLKQLPDYIKPSFFEFTTIMAFCYFKEQNVDYAIIEVGLGGRLDSTNIIQPLVSAITNVQLDHQNILGNTIEEIAGEKAGIIKKNTPIISGDSNPMVKSIIQNKANEVGAPFTDATSLSPTYELALKGNYQQYNLRVVIGLVNALRNLDITITEESVVKGLLNVNENTGFIGRWSTFSTDPLTILDTGHNQAGLEEVFSQLKELPQHKHIVLGFVNDKKIDEVLKLLPENADYYFVKPSVNRGRNPEEYEADLKKVKISYKIFQNVQSGYEAAKQSVKKDEMIFIGGSNFVIGDFLEKNLQE